MAHRYWSVVESRRLGNGSTAQRQVLYLGAINNSQQSAWRKTLEVFDEDRGRSRQCEPGSEFALHRRWFDASAMDELLGMDFAVAEKDRLYRCLDRVLPHKDALCRRLTERWRTLFDHAGPQHAKRVPDEDRDALPQGPAGVVMDRGIPTKATLQRLNL